MHIESIADWLDWLKVTDKFKKSFICFLLKFSLQNLVIALIFSVYRWDGSTPYHYNRHTFAFEDLWAMLNTENIADWLKNGKVG